jgi:hypothetical protein
MKIGDYVAKITNDWQKHNKWMEFPNEKPQPLGVIVGQNSRFKDLWNVLTADGTVIDITEKMIVVIDDNI